MAVTTNGGTFTSDFSNSVKKIGTVYQVSALMRLSFTPNDQVKSVDPPFAIGLVQVLGLKRYDVSIEEVYRDDPVKLQRFTADGDVPELPGFRYYLDQATYAKPDGTQLSEVEAKKESSPVLPQINPVYCKLTRGSETKLWHGDDLPSYGNTAKVDELNPVARLIDSPGRYLLRDESNLADCVMSFETAAVALAPRPFYLGSVFWGFRVESNEISRHDITWASNGAARLPENEADPAFKPTASFLRARSKWNEQTVPNLAGGDVGHIALP
ncbi:hypothetical protein ACGFX8_34425 [Streptomyces sp. NPDC048362]|uniref:hypothetical protein n=1 Tax=Streptomyces sp. NPDC048362 TaxID=3365539 RepID=UPI0037170065